MLDILYILIGAAFLGVCVLYALACDRLGGHRHDTRSDAWRDRHDRPAGLPRLRPDPSRTLLTTGHP